MLTQRILIIFLFILAALATTIAVVPRFRDQAKTLLMPQSRSLLAKTTGQLFPGGPKVVVLKVQESGSLFLEIYQEDNASGVQTLLSRIRLEEKRDAHFTFQGNATNLALGDMDGDDVLEIFAPTFDEQMIARLNIYKYNKDQNNFDRINSTQSEQAPIAR